MKSPAIKPPQGLLWTIFLLTAIEFLQAGMIAFAASPIMGEINASPEEYNVATATYACVAVAVIAKQRWLVERMGWRLFVTSSLFVFCCGALICGSSDSFSEFLTGRFIMGLGGASFMTSGRVIVNLIPPSPARFSGIKYFASGLGAGITLAPGVAAFFVHHESWNMIFGVLISVAMVTMVLAHFYLPQDVVPKELRSQSHPIFFLALIFGSFLLLYVIQRFQYDFFTDGHFLAVGIALGSLMLYHFFRGVHDQERPLLQLSGLHHPSYWMGVVLFGICYLLLGANNYMLPTFMQRTLGFAWHTVGEVQMIGLAATMGAWLVMAWCLPKWPGAKKFFVVGFLSLAFFGWHLSTLTGSANLWEDVLPGLLANGVFIIFVMATTAIQTFRDVQNQDAVFSNAQQLKNMVAQFCMALGVALATLCMQWRATEHYNVLNTKFHLDDHIFSGQVEQLAGVFSSSTGGVAKEVSVATMAQSLAQQANLLACIDYFHAITLMGLAGATIMLLQRLMK